MKKLYFLFAVSIFTFLSSSAQDNWSYDKDIAKETAMQRSKEQSEAVKQSRREEWLAKWQLPDNLKSASATAVAVDPSDSLALVALYNATNGDYWNNNENWLSGPVETWYGVEVNNLVQII